jgi:hypothetical protein
MSYVEQSGHLHEQDLELYLRDHVSQDSISAMESHLAACEDCANKLAEHDKCLWYLAELNSDELALAGERRRHPRLATNDPASLQVLNPFTAGAWQVRIVDVSEYGLRTHTPKSLATGSLIKVRMQYSVACGDVRYCIPTDDGFYAGVRLHDYFVPGEGSTLDHSAQSAI